MLEKDDGDGEGEGEGIETLGDMSGVVLAVDVRVAGGSSSLSSFPFWFQRSTSFDIFYNNVRYREEDLR